MVNTNDFQQSLHEIQVDYKNSKFLLAVSGGVDSMVLMNLFKGANLNFEVAHINYKLRGEDSDEDQKLVEGFCRQNQIPFHLYQISEKDKKPKNSIQEWARYVRYQFFRKVQQEQNLDFLVTAHHLNDQLETFIINLSKAAGIKGLSGIPAHENKILRPLLGFSKEEIYDYAKKNKIKFREDVSNQKNDYLRNKIRNEIAPKLLNINENFLKNFSKSILYLNQTKSFVEEKISEIEKEIIINKEDYLSINKELFLDQSDFIQFEILRKYGFNEVEEIAKIRKAKTGKKFISTEFQLTIDREIFIVKKIVDTLVKENEDEIILELNSDNQIIIPEDIHHEIKELGKTNWKIDGDKIQFPLKLRRKKTGDIFHPIGMIGKKKISKFFKDEKIPILAQQKIWLLCDESDKVLGIISFRQDRRFAASTESSKIIKVKL
ncbi:MULTISPECIES: tRNA lysidine(34) synthetase TilS [unclassified Kaistella]|uniref:tRNA lysidine(34) synthetase TilS n=1 Tax=unclassified Kaistella TaxID=2762626 RepID=UPI0027331073|nr:MULTISPECIES: tRNA lysidine(34) synthetase TilS [unclassified Kaistella]MDP2454900.1 tRNA lysidine(34) synthetase TilS [Kaistella sp. SH11-4b]MDP2456117.1 tRNA lysidine(34) synthetase TilS [Kaistella sp. SH40-3]MDP2460570.1 tRNA lysidine(34) synthetase TilS [Kaistella sp. SH19-2b]